MRWSRCLFTLWIINLQYKGSDHFSWRFFCAVPVRTDVHASLLTTASYLESIFCTVRTIELKIQVFLYQWLCVCLHVCECVMIVLWDISQPWGQCRVRGCSYHRLEFSLLRGQKIKKITCLVTSATCELQPSTLLHLSLQISYLYLLWLSSVDKQASTSVSLLSVCTYLSFSVCSSMYVRIHLKRGKAEDRKIHCVCPHAHILYMCYSSCVSRLRCLICF